MLKTKLLVAALAATALRPLAYDGDDWSLKMEDGKPVLKDGKPVYIQPDGSEFVADVPKLYGQVASLRNEAADHRKAKKEAETKLEAFKDVDPEKYQEAIEALEKIDQKKLIDAGEVDRVKADVSKGFETKIAELERNRDEQVGKYKTRYERLAMSNAFNRSKFIQEKIGIQGNVLFPFTKWWHNNSNGIDELKQGFPGLVIGNFSITFLLHGKNEPGPACFIVPEQLVTAFDK